jgi:predicted nucleic acid-binding Zn ribbon protein
MTAQRDDDRDQHWDDDEADFDDDSDGEPTVSCPYCSQEILEDSPYCPHCQRYVSAEDHAGPRRPLWVMVTALICLGVAIWWVFAG